QDLVEPRDEEPLFLGGGRARLAQAFDRLGAPLLRQVDVRQQVLCLGALRGGGGDRLERLLNRPHPLLLGDGEQDVDRRLSMAAARRRGRQEETRLGRPGGIGGGQRFQGWH